MANTQATERNSKQLTPRNLSNFIPENELAQEITVAPVPMPEQLKTIPEEEKAIVKDATSDCVEKFRDLGFFSPAKGMCHIKNSLGDMISARIYEDRKGYRFIEYIQQYRNGSFSPVMSVPLSSIRIIAKKDFITEDIKDSRIRSKMEKFMLNAIEDYHGKFRGPVADEISVKDILNTLYRLADDLPVVSDMEVDLTGEMFYFSVVKNISELMIPASLAKNYKAYFPLEDDSMNDLASSMGMEKRELLKKLKQEGFLYLTPSSRGYQTNIRIKSPSGESYTQWMYCIWKLSYFAGVDEDVIKEEEMANNFDF